MRRAEEVRIVQDLAAEGLNNCEIARRTGIPRTTVRDWRAGKLPTRGALAEGRCATCGHPKHDASRLPAKSYAYLLGMYLGDGCIATHSKGVHRLRIACDMKYPIIILDVSIAMFEVMPTSRVATQWRLGGGRGAEVSAYSKAWVCLFPQHGPGEKHRRRIMLEPWQQEIVDAHPQSFIRGLIQSDGCRVRNRVNGKDYPRYFFTQVSDDIKRLFCRSLTQLGIRYTWNDHKNVSIARRPDVARLDEFVGPKR
jgi:Homeodomain-like domain